MSAYLRPVPAEVQAEEMIPDQEIEEIEAIIAGREFEQFEFELITGRQLNRNASASQRAVIADDLRRGKYAVIRHTVQQAECNTGANRVYVAIAHSLSDNVLNCVRWGYVGLAQFVKAPATDHQAHV
jgi:hypothetical protein